MRNTMVHENIKIQHNYYHINKEGMGDYNSIGNEFLKIYYGKFDTNRAVRLSLL